MTDTRSTRQKKRKKNNTALKTKEMISIAIPSINKTNDTLHINHSDGMITKFLEEQAKTEIRTDINHIKAGTGFAVDTPLNKK